MSREPHTFSLLEASARRWPGRTAVCIGDRAYTYEALRTAAEGIAVQLRDAGLERGDLVGLMFPNGPEYVAAFYGILRAGGVVVPVSPELKSQEVEALARQMDLDAVLRSELVGSPLAGYADAQAVEGFAGGDRLFIQRAVEPRRDPAERARLIETGAANIRFTSGTTSSAKGVILSHGAILERGRLTARNLAIGEDECLLFMLSMAHHFIATISAFILKGARIVAADAMDPRDTVKLVARHRPTRLFAAPLTYRMLTADGKVKKPDLAGVKYFVSTATALPEPVARDFRSKFGREIVQMYGLIEVGIPFINLSEDEAYRGSVGTLGTGYEVRLAPVKGGGDAAEQGAAELFIRGSGLFEGYFRPWRPRDEVLEDGWFRSGDLVRRDEAGYFWIAGRSKDIINVGGIKIYPAEIEDALSAHPSVDEALVFGAEDARFGQAPHAKVTLVAGAQCDERELVRFARGRLSVFKVPRTVTIVESLPKTATGKVRRY